MRRRTSTWYPAAVSTRNGPNTATSTTGHYVPYPQPVTPTPNRELPRPHRRGDRDSAPAPNAQERALSDRRVL